MSHARSSRDEPSLTAGALAIVALGVALGLAYNAVGLRATPAWGVAWIGVDRVAEMPTLAATSGGPSVAPRTISDDPMAPVVGASGVPEVPDLDRPIAVGLDEVRAFVDHDAALVIDAREPFEYAEGHIPGALSLPYDEVITDPARLEQLDSGGRPYIVYCGGGTCEISLDLAHEMLALGKRRVLVYMGGYPEWEGSGQPVTRDGATS